MKCDKCGADNIVPEGGEKKVEGWWPIGYVNLDGGITFEPGREPGELEPFQLIYVSHQPKKKSAL